MKYRFLPALFCCLVCCGHLLAQGEPCGTVTISNPDTINLCQGDTLQLMQTNDLADANLEWSPDEGFIDPVTSPNPRVIPQFSRYYRVRVGTEGECRVADSIFVNVDRFVVPELIADTTICQGSELQLVRDRVTDPGDTDYLFAGGSNFLDDTTDVNAIYTVGAVDTVFTLISTARNGVCADTQQVTVTVISSEFRLPSDTIFTCLGDDQVTITVDAFPNAGPITWSPNRFVIGEATGEEITVVPTADITYFAEATVNGCFQRDSIAVRLDSLPQDLSMTLDPEKDPYCQGDTFNVRSPIYDTGDFPLIAHDWIEAEGAQDPLDLYEGVFIAQDTTTLVRVTENGGCLDTTEITVNVVEPPMVVFDPPMPVICPGEPLQITATFVTGAGTLEWMDPEGTLSCTDCLNPVATVSSATEYMITVTAEGSECTSPLAYSIQVRTEILPTLTANINRCATDDPIALIAEGFDPTATYQITSDRGLDTDNGLVLIQPEETTTYTVVTTTECGTVDTQTVTINVSGSTIPLNITGNTTVRSDENLTLRVDFADGSNPDGAFIWTLPNGTTSGGQEINVNPPVAGEYEVLFTEGGSTACPSFATVVVTVVDATVVAPDVITPNGDGRNDGFRLFFSSELTDYTMIIWNRWGQEVWTSTNPEEYWDGTIDGTPQNQDVYLFSAKFRQDGVEDEQSGQFTLIR